VHPRGSCAALSGVSQTRGAEPVCAQRGEVVAEEVEIFTVEGARRGRVLVRGRGWSEKTKTKGHVITGKDASAVNMAGLRT
jgi:hypothetical protein